MKIEQIESSTIRKPTVLPDGSIRIDEVSVRVTHEPGYSTRFALLFLEQLDEALYGLHSVHSLRFFNLLVRKAGKDGLVTITQRLKQEYNELLCKVQGIVKGVSTDNFTLVVRELVKCKLLVATGFRGEYRINPLYVWEGNSEARLRFITEAAKNGIIADYYPKMRLTGDLEKDITMLEGRSRFGLKSSYKEVI
jgi:hypothetical protein